MKTNEEIVTERDRLLGLVEKCRKARERSMSEEEDYYIEEERAFLRCEINKLNWVLSE